MLNLIWIHNLCGNILRNLKKDTWLEIDLLEYPKVHLDFFLNEFFCVNVDRVDVEKFSVLVKTLKISKILLCFLVGTNFFPCSSSNIYSYSKWTTHDNKDFKFQSFISSREDTQESRKWDSSHIVREIKSTKVFICIIFARRIAFAKIKIRRTKKIRTWKWN